VIEIHGLCGDPVCLSRIEIRLLLPLDPDVSMPCEQCAAATIRALVAAHQDWLATSDA